MSVFLLDDRAVQVPAWVTALASFRRWLHSEEFPDQGRIIFIRGEVWVDMSKEQLFTHNQVKHEYNRVLGNLAREGDSGTCFADGTYLSNADADISNQPDGLFVSNESWQSGLVQLLPGSGEGFVELEGSPDMALEVVSDSSVEKDTILLREAYWRAGIREYWLVDVRGDRVQFDILRHTSRGYVPVPKKGGWQKSAVFGKSFRLRVGKNRFGHPVYTLEVR
jgi:Uma2 family endonuclease